MKDDQPIIPWLDHLFLLIPPSGIVLVGAGPGNGKWVDFLRERPDTPSLLVEADPAQFKHLERIAPTFPNWQISREVIAKETGPVRFFQTSVSSENSLIDPEALRFIRPNHSALQALERHAITLADLFRETSAPVSWLLIDCLPAQPIIEGARAGLDGIDIVVARIITTTTDGLLESASLRVLKTYLGQRGFRLLSIEAMRHPSLGHALFIRQECFDDRKLKKAESRVKPKLQIDKAAVTIEQAKIEIEMLTRVNADSGTATNQLLATLQALRVSYLALEARQTLIDEELESAKVQIELIEKLLLSESGP